MMQTVESHRAITIPLPVKLTLAALAFYVCFLGMETVHEFGHVICAIATGGRVVRVDIPLIGTSQTRVAPNPQPIFEIAGGPLIGSLIPLIACILARYFTDRVPESLKFFAGFCLVANGAYLAVGSFWPMSDAGELLRLDVPRETLVAVGITFAAFGLLIWH